MSKPDYNGIYPSILGLTWIPGDLVLVGSGLGCGRSSYVLGNCIVEGVKGDLPVAYFAPGRDLAVINRNVLYMSLGSTPKNDEDDPLSRIPEYKLHIDVTPKLTIAYLVERIFHMVESLDVRMVVVDGLQDIDGSVFSPYSKEHEMRSILSVLKSLADAFRLVVIVTSELSESHHSAYDKPSPRDILYVPNAEEIFDQIILIQPLQEPIHAYNIVLPKGHRHYDGQYGEMVIHAMLDWDLGYFKKADQPFVVEDDLPYETPMFKWYQDINSNNWLFEFIDSKGMGWIITIAPSVESEYNEYDIDAESWAGDHINIAMGEPGDDMEKLKAFALREVRRRFPEVEIPEKS